jgi:hypothetical protein
MGNLFAAVTQLLVIAASYYFKKINMEKFAS